MIAETFEIMFKLKSEDKKEIDIWNYAQPYFGKKLAFAFGTFSIIQAISTITML